MVIKLMKHELRALFRIVLYLGIATLGLTIIGRLLMLGDPESVLGILFCVIGIYLGLIVVLSGFIWSVRQFYSSLFTGEGYMTFSLPVTPMQIIWSKLLSALIMSLFGSVIFLASFSIFATALPPEAIQEYGQIFAQLFDALGTYFASDPLLAVEAVIQFILLLPMELLFFYAVISVGQLFTKGRKWITFTIGFVALVIVLPILTGYCLDPILEAASRVSVHLSSWISIILYAGIDVGCFFLIRYILSHRVNLIV